MKSNVEQADSIGRARAVTAPFIGFALLSVQQWLFFGSSWDTLSVFQLSVWVVLATFTLLIVLTGGTWLIPRNLGRLVDDESSRMNRLVALSRGFSAAIVLALIVFIVSPFEPITAQHAAHLIVSIGLGVSLLSFGVAESRFFD